MYVYMPMTHASCQLILPVSSQSYYYWLFATMLVFNGHLWLDYNCNRVHRVVTHSLSSSSTSMSQGECWGECWWYNLCSPGLRLQHCVINLVCSLCVWLLFLTHVTVQGTRKSYFHFICVLLYMGLPNNNTCKSNTDHLLTINRSGYFIWYKTIVPYKVTRKFIFTLYVCSFIHGFTHVTRIQTIY